MSSSRSCYSTPREQPFNSRGRRLRTGVLVRADFWKGMRTATFQFSESGGSLNGPGLFTELPFLQKSLPNASRKRCELEDAETLRLRHRVNWRGPSRFQPESMQSGSIQLQTGTKKEHKPKLLSSDIFRWGRGLPRE